MKSWLEFEQRFRALEPAFKHVRLDGQWGAAGDDWRLAGGPFTPKHQEFELLATLAGEMLKVVFKGTDDITEGILSEPDSRIRWYKALQLWSGQFRQDLVGIQTGRNDEHAGHVFGGTLSNVPECSANLCLLLQAKHPIPEKSTLRALWDEYGSKIVVGLILVAAAAALKLWFG